MFYGLHLTFLAGIIFPFAYSEAFVVPVTHRHEENRRPIGLQSRQHGTGTRAFVSSSQTFLWHQLAPSTVHRCATGRGVSRLVIGSLGGEETREAAGDESSGTRGTKESAASKGETAQWGGTTKGKKKETVFIRPLVIAEAEPVRRYGKPWTGERVSTTKAVMPSEKRADVVAMQSKLFEKRKWRLIGDNVFIGLLGTCGAWCFSFKTACSYGLGAVLGTFYLVLLARFVENIGKEGGGGGSARIILAVLLVLLTTKNKDTFDLIPAVIGFLTYQVSALVQAVYTDFDSVEDVQQAA